MKNHFPSSDDLLTQTMQQFWETVPHLWHHIRARIAREARESFSLTPQQFHILRRIHKGHTSVSGLAEAKHISRPAVSRAVDTLVEKGLVVRTQNPEDRRHIHLGLTPEGEAMLKAIFDEVTAWMREKLSVLEEDELKDIIESMGALHRAFH